jgi:transposase-like protein
MSAPKSPEFRRRASDLVAQVEPLAATARNLGISESGLRRWMTQDEGDRGDREGLSTTEKRELVELRRKNRVLETEIEVLKRASAYFARENVLPERRSGSSTSAPQMALPSQ